MADPYIGEIEFFAFNFAPRNWVVCAGQTLPINQYQALFSLLGTTYGGNGTTNFMLPDLRSRVPVGQGAGPGLQTRVIGETSGEENHTLLTTELPSHTHTLNVVANPATVVTTTPSGRLPAVGRDKVSGGTSPINFYSTATPDVVMAPTMIGPSGGALPHANIMPYLALNACISLSGIFPTRG